MLFLLSTDHVWTRPGMKMRNIPVSFLDSLTLLIISRLIKLNLYFSHGVQLQQEETDGVSFDGD